MKKYQPWVVLYATALLGDIVGVAAGLDHLHVFCKPLLMPLLIVGLFSNKKNIVSTPWQYIATGLFCSWAGDLFLLYEARNPHFFIGGLASFMVAHLCYIGYYFKCGASLSHAFKNHAGWCLLALAYSVGLVVLLLPKLGSLLIPVIAYAAVLTIMLITSIAAIGVVSKNVSVLFVIGASAFVFSDSLLAINKFYQPFAMAGVLIMLTYGAAQLLITKAAISNSKMQVSK